MRLFESGIHDEDAVHYQPRTNIPTKQHKIYPYLLKGKVINQPNQVWADDITYLCADGERLWLFFLPSMDWHSRKVLSWRLSNTMDADFCIQALEVAIQDHGCPQIFNTDQGAQFISRSIDCCFEELRYPDQYGLEGVVTMIIFLLNGYGVQ